MNLSYFATSLSPNVDEFCLNSESSCPDVQMGFCMESSGMTQGDPEDSHFGLQMEGDSGEVPTAETEFMEDDQDPEVRNHIVLSACYR